MAAPPTIDWNAVTNGPRFQALQRKKQGFLTGLMIFSVVFYFLLPIGAAYYQDLHKIKVWGVGNFGLGFALVQHSLGQLRNHFSQRATDQQTLLKPLKEWR